MTEDLKYLYIWILKYDWFVVSYAKSSNGNMYIKLKNDFATGSNIVKLTPNEAKK